MQISNPSDYLKKTSDIVFIIGGGPSLLKYVPKSDILKEKDIIATNNAYKLYPWALCCWFSDGIWWSWHKDIIRNFYQGPVMTSYTGSLKNQYKNIIYFKKGPEKGLSLEKDVIHGNNSGHQAINLAVICGYKDIVLLGFDMLSSSKKTQWHNEHQRPTVANLYDSTMIPNLNTIAPLQEKYKFKIWNINRESAIKCFEFADLSQFL